MDEKNIRTRIGELVYNDNSVDLLDILEGLESGTISSDDVSGVLSAKTVQRMERATSTPVPLPPALHEMNDKWERTEVYFWGVKGSGKTSAIGTILAVQPESFALQDEQSQGRAETLCKIFNSNEDVVLNFQNQAEKDFNIINIDLKDERRRIHPLSLIDVEFDDIANIPLKDSFIAKSSNDKIHVLCYDITQEGTQQDAAFMSLLDNLETSGILDTSVGVYLLVTKADTLKKSSVIELENTIQTKMTASHVAFWNRVSNACAKLEIHGVRPIPFSVGNVVLKRLVNVDLSYAKDLIKDPLLKKSNSYRSRLARILLSGPSWLNIMVLSGIGMFIVGVAYLTLARISPAPETEIKPCDFEKEFREQEARYIKEQPYSMAKLKFEELYDRLSVESSIVLNNDSLLLSENVANRCERLLVNDYAKNVRKEFRAQVEKRDWNATVLNDLARQIRERLLCSKVLKSEYRPKLEEYIKIANDFHAAQNLISSSHSCRTLNAVRNVQDNVKRYDRYPLTNCEEIKNGLKMAVENARNSYANYLLQRATDLKEAYNQNRFRIFDRSTYLSPIEDRSLEVYDEIEEYLLFLPQSSSARNVVLQAKGLLPYKRGEFNIEHILGSIL